ncbi:MAG TPA: polyprenyl diphosphate synthase, partial [Nitrospirota bacterium]|nr:polyprenyl diphosphate synthase [Nitrospirota bacterium]
MKKNSIAIEELRARLDPSGMPRHVAIIMDGNGRWAERRGMPRIAGHKKGADTVRKITEHSRSLGIEVLTLYAFSDENWGRPPAEIAFLMEMLVQYLKSELPAMKKNGIRLRTIGRIE